MSIASLIVGLLVGLLLGGLLAWLWLRGRELQLRAERDAATKGAIAEIAQVSVKAATEQFRQLEEATAKSATEDLEHRQEALERSVSELVKPVSEQLDRYRQVVEQLQTSSGQMHGELKGELQRLAAANAGLQKETANLVGALRRPEVRGSWGEQQLRRIVELAGMVEHCDFDEQVHGDSASGHAQRPDLVVRLPNERRVVVDAKVPLDAFLTGLAADDPADRERHMKRHAQQLRAHVEDLAKRSYAQGVEGSVDFVVAFVPNDALLAAAYEQDAAIVERAVADQVLIATPITLIALLRAVSYGWRQEAAARDAQAIVAAGRTLYERLSVLSDHIADLGGRLRSAVESYNKFVGSLEQRVLPQARRFETLRAPGTARSDLAGPAPVTEMPRPLTAPE
ncbi:MAG: DNA recombination protein RmuC, partial [Acidimicrobiales bacterium]